MVAAEARVRIPAWGKALIACFAVLMMGVNAVGGAFCGLVIGVILKLSLRTETLTVPLYAALLAGWLAGVAWQLAKSQKCGWKVQVSAVAGSSILGLSLPLFFHLPPPSPHIVLGPMLMGAGVGVVHYLVRATSMVRKGLRDTRARVAEPES